jgi:diguanylate cyclase (GGDEF)-like protein
MTAHSLAAWVWNWRAATLPPPSLEELGAGIARRLHLGLSALACVTSATLGAAAGAALRDRPSLLGAAVLLSAVAVVPVGFWVLATRILERLDGAVRERDVLQGELASARETKAQLQSLAYHDDLTGLPNRSLLNDRLGLAIAHALRQTSNLALLFLDLDGFKAVNDSYGHGSGDRLLVELATRVRGSVRAGDTVARLGGDEFVVLLDTVTGAEDAARVAAKVLDAVRVPFRLDGRDVSIAASVGVSVFPGDGTSPDELLKSADAAMYRDKQRNTPLSPDGRTVPDVGVLRYGQ